MQCLTRGLTERKGLRTMSRSYERSHKKERSHQKQVLRTKTGLNWQGLAQGLQKGEVAHKAMSPIARPHTRSYKKQGLMKQTLMTKKGSQMARSHPMSLTKTKGLTQSKVSQREVSHGKVSHKDSQKARSHEAKPHEKTGSQMARSHKNERSRKITRLMTKKMLKWSHEVSQRKGLIKSKVSQGLKTSKVS